MNGRKFQCRKMWISVFHTTTSLRGSYQQSINIISDKSFLLGRNVHTPNVFNDLIISDMQWLWKSSLIRSLTDQIGLDGWWWSLSKCGLQTVWSSTQRTLDLRPKEKCWRPNKSHVILIVWFSWNLEFSLSVIDWESFCLLKNPKSRQQYKHWSSRELWCRSQAKKCELKFS